MNIRFLAAALLFVFLPMAKGEYRAFLLQIKAKTGEPIRNFPSTLDPEQYRGYFPLAADEKIEYVETWMCRGRTGSLQKICDNPKALPKLPDGAQAPSRSPASPPATKP